MVFLKILQKTCSHAFLPEARTARVALSLQLTDEKVRMNRKLNVILGLAAGIVGGAVSRYLTPTPVLAQAQPMIPYPEPMQRPSTVPKQIRAQSFMLENEQTGAFGFLGFDADGTPIIKLVDQDGRTIWSTRATMLPTLARNRSK